MRRVVVTGLGIVSPLGTGTEKNWDALMKGQSGIAPITKFDASNMTSKIAGEVKDFKAEDYVSRKDVRRMDIFTQYAMAATRMAVEDASLNINGNNADRVGVVIGCGSHRLKPCLRLTKRQAYEAIPGCSDPINLVSSPYPQKLQVNIWLPIPEIWNQQAPEYLFHCSQAF